LADRLRPFWDFDDLAATEALLRSALDDEASDSGRAEVLTQLARVEGLRGDFDAGERLTAEAAALAGSSTAAEARIALERGRLYRSSGDPDRAQPLFEESFELALAAGEEFTAVDAAHMAALAAPGRAERMAWTERGLELSRASADAEYWAGPLLNNLGWDHYEAGEYEEALVAFEQALEARERDPENEAAIEIARYAVAKALRALDRAEEAVPLLEHAVAWTERAGAPDGWFHEELAEAYASLGRRDEAREHANLALPLLRAGDPSLPPERVARLEELTR
jgi:tetratricopeptide (TPR) repeat protein